jgi:hypothetical protein
MSTLGRPVEGEYAPYWDRYIRLVAGEDALGALEAQAREVSDAFSGVSEASAGYRYAPGKWSVREVLGHVIDTERMLACRALYFARGGEAVLPSFDENGFALRADHDRVPLRALVDEFDGLRASHVAMFRHLPDEAWERGGTAGVGKVTVRSLAFILVGHAAHHLAILRERYGVSAASA